MGQSRIEDIRGAEILRTYQRINVFKHNGESSIVLKSTGVNLESGTVDAWYATSQKNSMTKPSGGSVDKITGSFVRPENQPGLRDSNLVVEAPARPPEVMDWPTLESIVAQPLQKVAMAGGGAMKYTREVAEAPAESQGIGRIGYAFSTGLVALIALLIVSGLGHTGVSDYFAIAVVAVASIILAAKRLQNIGGTGGSAWAMVLPPVGVLIFLFCLVAPENYMKSGKLDAPALFTIGLLGVGVVAMAATFLL
ncbi:hypothetical protein BH09VER1_BH09VER1_51430 [soil metagenome]